MNDESEIIWLRFRCDRGSLQAHLLRGFGIDAVETVANGKRLLMRENGESYSSNGITVFAKQLAELLLVSNENSGSILKNAILKTELPKEVERSVIELTVVLFAYTLEFSNLTKTRLKGATLECLYEERHGTAAFHVSLPGSPSHERLFSPSVYVDMFLDDQRKLYCSTMDILSSEMSIIDDIVALFGELSILATNLATARVISLFILSVSQDFAPACSLVLGGRLDAAYFLLNAFHD